MADNNVLKRQQQAYEAQHQNYDTEVDEINRKAAAYNASAGPHPGSFTGVAPDAPRAPTTDEAAALRGETNPAALAMSEQSKRSPLFDRVREMRERGILARVMGGDLATQHSTAKPILGI